MGKPKLPKVTALPPPPTPAVLQPPKAPSQKTTAGLGGTYLTSGISGGGLLTKGKQALTQVLGG